MLWLERQVVATLVAQRDQQQRSAVADYVDGVLQAMPVHLRIGLAGESLVLGVRPALGRLMGRLDTGTIDRCLHRWSASPLGPVRQYVRLFHSLVLFADHELGPEAEGCPVAERYPEAEG